MPRPEADRQAREVVRVQPLVAGNIKRHALSRKLFGEFPHPAGVARKLEEELSVAPGRVVTPADMHADDEISMVAQPSDHRAARLLERGDRPEVAANRFPVPERQAVGTEGPTVDENDARVSDLIGLGLPVGDLVGDRGFSYLESCDIVTAAVTANGIISLWKIRF